MPANRGGSLKPDEVDAVVAYLLYMNGIIQETDVMDAQSLPKVRMPQPGWLRTGQAGLAAEPQKT